MLLANMLDKESHCPVSLSPSPACPPPSPRPPGWGAWGFLWGSPGFTFGRTGDITTGLALLRVLSAPPVRSRLPQPLLWGPLWGHFAQWVHTLGAQLEGTDWARKPGSCWAHESALRMCDVAGSSPAFPPRVSQSRDTGEAPGHQVLQPGMSRGDHAGY